MLNLSTLATPAQNVVGLVQRQIVADGRVATGALVNSVRQTVESKPNGVRITISAFDYALPVDLGRGPSRRSQGGIVKQRIKEWLQVKGIATPPGYTQDGLAYVIARKIHREGFKGSGFVRKVVQSPEFLVQLDAIKQNVINQLINGTNA